jgi:hypothetical protein
MLERLNQQLKEPRPGSAACALAAESHEGWLVATHYFNMSLSRRVRRKTLEL